jgi:integrase
MIISLALGTGLRESEIAALDVGDLTNKNGRCRRRVELRVFKRCTDARTTPQEVFLNNTLRHKLNKYLDWKRDRGESLETSAPLFVSRKGNRISTRRMRAMFRDWQAKAGFERLYHFHCLRHTACTNLYRDRRDIREVQRFARHTNIHTTSIYSQPSDQDLIRAVERLPC